MAAVIEQAERFISLSTPLGDNVLVLQSFSGTEELSRPYHYQLEMLSDDDGIKAADIVGKNVTFSMKLADGSLRYFNGFVSRFTGSAMMTRQFRRYDAEVVPWFWFLTRTSDCRIFQNKTVPDIIEEIFGDLGFDDYELKLTGDHPERIYCVQYRETAFNFVSRLMEDEGIFYWFKHEDGKHTMVLADQASAYDECPESELAYFPGSLEADHITSWDHQYEFRSGKYAQTDYNFESPSASLMTNTNTLIDQPGADTYELYDYWGGYKEKGVGETLTKLRMEAEEVPYDTVLCVSNCRTLLAGGKFTVERHDCLEEEGNAYVITSVQHSAADHSQHGGGSEHYYQNSFTCIPDAVVFRPPRLGRKPRTEGPQTAVVVGPSGEEIYTDKYGRVKVQFHWDRKGKNDENSSCWVRVSSPWAGKSWGAVSIPRIGQEVIVDFLEGDVDSPIITGRVYNAEQMPPYGLPGSKVISGLKSNSTLGGGGYNEYVMDDTKGNELIREHGQFDKDSTIENDLREHVLHDRSRDVTNNETVQVGVDRSKTIGNNETTSVGVDRTETVGSNETIGIGSNRTETVGSNESITVGGSRTRNVGKNETVTVALARTHSVGVNEAITVGGAQEVTVGAMQAVTVGAARALTVGASQDVNVGANLSESVGGNRTENVSGNQTEKVDGDRGATIGKNDSLKVAKNLVIDAGDQVTIKTGKASITMKKDGTIAVQGKDISFKASGAINAKASKNIVLKGKKILEN